MESNKREKEIQSRRTLLIADDDEISGDILASFFEKDYDILRAYTGREDHRFGFARHLYA